MNKIILGSAILALSLQATTITQGWNLLGAKDDIVVTDVVSNQIESVYTYEDDQWTRYDNNSDATIPSGKGFWYYSSAHFEYELPQTSGDEISLSNGWNLVAPTQNQWDISTKFPNTQYGWKYTNSQWQLYTQESNDLQEQYPTFSTVDVGEGVWLYNFTTYNALIGDTQINIENGSFGSFTKENIDASTQAQLIDDVANLYDIRFGINETNTNLDNFRVGIRLTRQSTNSQYYYFVTVNSTTPFSNPKVELQKSDGSSLGTTQVEAPVLELLESSTQLKLNFHKIVKYLIDANYYTFEALKDRLAISSGYKYEIYGYNIDIIGSSKLTENETVNNRYVFPTDSSKVEGIINIQ